MNDFSYPIYTKERQMNIADPVEGLRKFQVRDEVFYTFKHPRMFLEFASLIDDGKKVGAIKLFRAHTGNGLKVSKEYTEMFYDVLQRNVMRGLVSQLLLEEPQYSI